MHKGAAPFIVAGIVLLGISVVIGMVVIGDTLKKNVALRTADDQVEIINLKYDADSERISLDNRIWVASEKAKYANIIRGMFPEDKYNPGPDGVTAFWRDAGTLSIPNRADIIDDIFNHIRAELDPLISSPSVIEITSIDYVPNGASYDIVTETTLSVSHSSDSSKVTGQIYGDDSSRGDYVKRHFYIYDNSKPIAETSRSVFGGVFSNSVSSFKPSVPCGSVPTAANTDTVKSSFIGALNQNVNSRMPSDLDASVVDAGTTVTSNVVQTGTCRIQIGTRTVTRTIDGEEVEEEEPIYETHPVYDVVYSADYIVKVSVKDNSKRILTENGLADYQLSFLIRDSASA